MEKEIKSPYDKGLGLKIGRLGPGIDESKDFTGRAFELLKILNEVRFITSTSAAKVLGCSRITASKALKTLWFAAMVKNADIVTDTGLFKIWMSAEEMPPKSANEACRFASLALFYSLAKKEVPGLSWKLHRNKNGENTVEMNFINQNKETIQWIIDAPRDEENLKQADLYIFPSIEQSKNKTPEQKMYTSDDVLLNIEIGQLRNNIYIADNN